MAEQEQMGQLALILGDFHLPLRCSQIPLKYKEMITPNKVSAVFCTGNLCSREVHDWVKSLAPVLHVVKGDYEDETIGDFPDQKVFEFCGVKIAMIHGHQIIPWADQEVLLNKAKQLDAKLMITGHSHQMQITHQGGTYFMNPGSMTGAYTALNPNVVPSFLILEFRTAEIVIYEYSLVDDQLKCIDSKIPKP